MTTSVTHLSQYALGLLEAINEVIENLRGTATRVQNLSHQIHNIHNNINLRLTEIENNLEDESERVTYLNERLDDIVRGVRNQNLIVNRLTNTTNPLLNSVNQLEIEVRGLGENMNNLRSTMTNLNDNLAAGLYNASPNFETNPANNNNNFVDTISNLQHQTNLITNNNNFITNTTDLEAPITIANSNNDSVGRIFMGHDHSDMLSEGLNNDNLIKQTNQNSSLSLE